uniref:Cathepsin L1 n=1 Tax=Lygus hesperus TaxID=30085 RepID=A0A0A9XEZ6_LYGHE
MYDAYNNVYVHYKEYSGKMEPVLVQAEYKFVMSSWNVPGSKIWAHTKKVFNDYQPCEPDPELWERPKNVECKVVDADVAEYMIYLLATYMGLPTDSSFNELFLNETYYIGDKKTIPVRSFDGISNSRKYIAKRVHHSEASVSFYSEENDQDLVDELPKSWDWRKMGAVTEVKDQGICQGGSWAFGVVGAVEGAYFLKTKKLVNLSEQALIDCSWEFGNSGCFRGSSEGALKWIKKNGGLPVARRYGRFQEGHGYCLAAEFKPVAQIKDFVRVPPRTNAVKSALVKHGPLVARIFAPYDLRYYTSADGVYHSAMEGEEQYVVLIGYGSFNNEPYWLIKNSWSSNWGMDGYAMISSDDNSLHILDSVYYVDM